MKINTINRQEDSYPFMSGDKRSTRTLEARQMMRGREPQHSTCRSLIKFPSSEISFSSLSAISPRPDDQAQPGTKCMVGGRPGSWVQSQVFFHLSPCPSPEKPTPPTLQHFKDSSEQKFATRFAHTGRLEIIIILLAQSSTVNLE